jgi:hypothetical protein
VPSPVPVPGWHGRLVPKCVHHMHKTSEMLARVNRVMAELQLDILTQVAIRSFWTPNHVIILQTSSNYFRLTCLAKT